MAERYVLGLLRHGKSDYPAGVGDHDRPLSARGRSDSAAAGPLVDSRIGPIDLALVSDAARAQQTWSLTRTRASDVRHESRIYEASASALLEVVTEISDEIHSILMVGHNPGFENLAYHLTGHDSDPDALERLNEKYPTCALAVFESGTPFSHWESVKVRLRSFDAARGV